jgi:phenylacetyl-CoA:acceptor oxidoreductase subunit 1
MERIDAGRGRGLKPGIDREATPACVNTCQARALTFGDLDSFDSPVSKLLRERRGFQLHLEYGTNPSIYYVDRRRIGTADLQPGAQADDEGTLAERIGRHHGSS